MTGTVNRFVLAMASLFVVLNGGCSTLGLSLYPSTSTLTTEAKAVLDASRIPLGIPRENAKTILPPHALQPGDAVLIESLQFERDLRLPADQIVLADGTVDLGPFGRLVVAGRSLEQVESLIERQITFQLRQQNEACKQVVNEGNQISIDELTVPDRCDAIAINVRLLEPVHQFYVLGEVNAPGAYPLTGDETVLDAIVSAGGLTSSANPCKILLARPTDPHECRVTLPVCYREIVQMGNTATNYQLQPGDRVFVASRSCIDELMFWKASRPCERCCGCNRACRNPGFVTSKPMAWVEETMIPPGSAGWMQLDNDPMRPSTLVEPDRINGADLPAESMEELTQPSVGERIPADSDVDGELDFPPR